FPVAERVGSDPLYPARLNVSVSDSGVLVFDPSVNRQNSQILWVDCGGKQIGSLGVWAGGSGPRLSPDEKRVAADREDPQTSNTDLWLSDVTGGNAARFTFDPALDQYPLWSPDGSRIVWASTREG